MKIDTKFVVSNKNQFEQKTFMVEACSPELFYLFSSPKSEAKTANFYFNYSATTTNKQQQQNSGNIIFYGNSHTFFPPQITENQTKRHLCNVNELITQKPQKRSLSIVCHMKYFYTSNTFLLFSAIRLVHRPNGTRN